jgi:DNA-binding LacI/PurR family transcriptional regulator
VLRLEDQALIFLQMHPEKKSPATIGEIAKIIGISKSTVSRALSHHPQIAEKTRLKVEQTAKKLNFRKNPLLAQLTSQLRLNKKNPYRGTLAFLNAFSNRELRKDWTAYYQTYLACQNRANIFGYEVEPFWIKEPGLSGKRASQILLARNTLGLIIPPLPKAHGHLNIDWKHFACATTGYVMFFPPLHCSACDHYYDISIVLRKLRKYGYQRIGLALRPDSNQYSDGLFKARFLLEQNAIRSSDCIPILCDDGKNLSFNYKNFLCWIDKFQPQVVITMAPDVSNWCKKAGIKVPGDLALADLDLYVFDGSRAGIKSQTEAVAEAAVDLIIEQINNHSFGIPKYPRSIYFKGEWIDGKTLPQK